MSDHVITWCMGWEMRIVVVKVALGRLALEPLGVLSALTASTGKEILSLNLHPLQAHAPELDLLKAAERNLMTATAQVKCFLPLFTCFCVVICPLNRLWIANASCILPLEVCARLQRSKFWKTQIFFPWYRSILTPSFNHLGFQQELNLFFGVLCWK